MGFVAKRLPRMQGQYFYRSWAGWTTIFGRVQIFPERAAPTRIWHPRNIMRGVYCPPSWRPPATQVSLHAPSHVAVHALQNNSTFCINPASTITMFGTSVMPTTYSDSSQDNPMKFEIPRSSTHWFMSLLDTLVPGRLWAKYILLHIMPKFGEFFISRVQKFNKEFSKNVYFQVCTKSILGNKDVIPNWNRPGRIGSRNHTLFVVVEDMLQGSEDPTRYIQKNQILEFVQNCCVFWGEIVPICSLAAYCG